MRMCCGQESLDWSRHDVQGQLQRCSGGVTGYKRGRLQWRSAACR